MEIPNLFRTIAKLAEKTGYLTIDELVILHSNPACWLWLEKELTNYAHVCPAILHFEDVEKIK